MSELDKDFITRKIGRAHRAKRNSHGTSLSVIEKISHWIFSEQVKFSFIKASKDKKDETPIIISQMCLAALTKRRNNAMIKWKELRKDDHRIQAYTSSAYGQVPRGISLHIICRILDWLVIDNSAHIFCWGRKSVVIPWKTKRKNQESHEDDILCVWCEMKVTPKKQAIVRSTQKNILRRSEAKKRLVWALLW